MTSRFFPRLLLLIYLAWLPAWAMALELQGRVVSVLDGDTIDVLDADQVKHRIRLNGVDAPEKAQAYGRRSREILANLVAGKAVKVYSHKKDRYGRFVGKVVVDGTDANLAQLRGGMAWFYRQYKRELDPTDRELYESAEILARERHLGLWKDKDPVPPWDWRHRKDKSR